jgi:hypothetical protein
MSISNRSWDPALKFDNASSGSLNASTAKMSFLSCSRPFFIDRVRSASSSTSRILYWGLLLLEVAVVELLLIVALFSLCLYMN